MNMLKKSLSQNLIKDRNILRKMVNVSGISGSDIVVEIGAGQGDLTRFLALQAKRVYAIELDRTFREHLDRLHEDHDNVEVFFGDVLSRPLVPKDVDERITIFGNIPYGITGPILFKILGEKERIAGAFLTMQREVAERIVSPPRKRTYGAISVIFQLNAAVKILFYIKPQVFIPPPKVESAFISMQFTGTGGSEDRDCQVFIKACFENKRKFLRHTLVKHYGEDWTRELYERMNLKPNIRAEEIDPQFFVSMYQTLSLLQEMNSANKERER